MAPYLHLYKRSFHKGASLLAAISPGPGSRPRANRSAHQEVNASVGRYSEFDSFNSHRAKEIELLAHGIRTSGALLMLLGGAMFAQEAKVVVNVSPKQAYVFLDGAAKRDGNVTLKTTAGEHTIAVYNYGYKGQERTITLHAGKNEPITFSLQLEGAKVEGPHGLIQIEADGGAAVLLNGKTPDYLVGHVDEFNNHIGWKQQLAVPPGTHFVTVTRKGRTIWSAPVEVAAGERVIVYASKNKIKRQKVGNGPAERPRFHIGTASAMISVAPVSGTLTATPGSIYCSKAAQLAYSSVDTLHSTITDGSESKPLDQLAGNVTVNPLQTTTYTFEASGPGGTVKQAATVNVDPTVESSLEVTPAEVHYFKVGDRVLRQESSELKWSALNADSISIDPMGTVSAIGIEKLTQQPKTATGVVDETYSFTLTAKNVCGGSDTHTVKLKLTGDIEPYVLSVFFPTDYPRRKHPDAGLLASQQAELVRLAHVYSLYLQQALDAKIVIRAYADQRGPEQYNLKLSERRGAVVKAFLVSQGIPENSIQLEALGEKVQLTKEAIAQLEAENPFKTEPSTEVKPRTAELAYNRRIDIEVLPADIQTSRFYPLQSADVALLQQRSIPKLKEIVTAQQAPFAPAAGEQAATIASGGGNQ